jgi:hypothetical protein
MLLLQQVVRHGHLLSGIYLLGHLHMRSLLRLLLPRGTLGLLVWSWCRCGLGCLLAGWCRCACLRSCLRGSLIISLLALLVLLLALLALRALLALLSLLTVLALLSLLALLLTLLALALSLGLRSLLLASHLTLSIGTHRILALHVLHSLVVHLHMLTLVRPSLHLRIMPTLLLLLLLKGELLCHESLCLRMLHLKVKLACIIT